MSALEKFKRRLVRDIARRQYVEGQPEDEMWDQLKIEYGCDCFLLWQHMKVLTSKKLKRMLAAEDRMDLITPVARMTSTDWLAFDLVLVHQDVDVIGEELIQSGKPESPVLERLFQLVMSHEIENLSGDRLVAKWVVLTRKYNTRGRECSPMLLQRRWYQLKDLSRRRFYQFWWLFRGNAKNLAKATRPTKLQIRVTERLPNLITKRFVQWKDLINSGKIIQAVQFESRRRNVKPNCNSDDPDLVVIEPHVETIEVTADSDDEDGHVAQKDNTEDITPMDENEKQFEHTSKTAENNTKSTENDNASDRLNKDSHLKVSVKTEPIEVLELNDTLSDDEPMETDNIEVIEENSASEEVENDATYPEDDTVFPKITNIMGNVDMTESNDKCNPTCQETVTNEVISDSEDPPIESDITLNIISEDSNKTVEENVKKKFPFSSEDVMDFNELPSTLEFVDDGIDFVDDDEESVEEEKPDTEDGDEIVNLDDVDPSYGIDRKLIMIPITYTKKLDDMEILQNIDYSTVKGNELIELIEAQSRSIKINTENIKTEVETENEQIDETAIEDHKVTKHNVEIDEARIQDYIQVNNEGEIENADNIYGIKVKIEKEEIDKTESEDDTEKCEVPRIKYTSWLLQKPKHRNYNPILLCKNPDFNTRLKRLSVGFFLSERNRRLFNACKPLTIDMHKAFESKLVNNVLYLETTTIPNIKRETVPEACENTASVIPSAVPVQSLLDITRAEHKDVEPEKLQMDKSKPAYEHKNEKVIERGHVINEPLNSPMACATGNLLNAAVCPAPTSVSDNQPAQLVESELNTRHNLINDKKNKKAKPKPPPPVPKWSNYSSNLPQYEESLITQDTLHKVICLLDTGMFLLRKKAPPVEAPKRPNTRLSAGMISGGVPQPLKKVTKKETVKLPADENKLNSKQNMTVENSLEKVAKRKRNRANQTIAANSGFCCWSRHQIEFVRPEINNTSFVKSKKYRHLCPMLECFCCCQKDLLNLLTSGKQLDDHTYSCDGEIPGPKERETTVKVIRDVAIQARSIQNEYGEMEIKSAIELYHPQNKNLPKNDQGTRGRRKSKDTGSNLPITRAVIHSSVSTQFENKYDVTTQFTHTNTCDTVSHVHAKTPPPIKANIIPAIPHRGNKAEVLSVTASAGWQSAIPSVAIDNNIVQKAVIETISLIEEEPSYQTPNSPPQGLLPQGVNILLLPDNTLSVSIDPGVKIDPASLSKLPEILSVVQKKLLESGTLNRNLKLPIRKWKYPIRKDIGFNYTNSNMPVNQQTNVQLNPQINVINENANVTQENAEFHILNTQVNDTEDNAELIAIDPKVQITEESALLRILKSDVNVSKDNAELIAMGPKVHVTEESAQLHMLTPEVNVTHDNAELIAMVPEVQVSQESAQLHILTSETDVEKENVNMKILNNEENAEFIVMKPKEPFAEQNTESNIVSTEDDVSQDTAEVNLMCSEDHISEESVENLDMNSERNVGEKSADQNLNAGDAENHVVNSEFIATQGNIENNVVNAELNTIPENTGLNSQYSNTNTDFNTAQSTHMLYVGSTNSESKEATEENVRKDDEDKLTYTDYIVKVAPETNRKSILSDLMTMSGISTEDTNMATESPVINNVTTEHNTYNVINNVATTNIINSNLQNNPYYLTNTQNIGGNIQISPPPKKVKKVMVFIKKKLKKKTTTNNSVIDLTEDDTPADTPVDPPADTLADTSADSPADPPADTSKQNEPPSDYMQKKENNSKKILNLKRAKLIRVPAAAVPTKIYQAAQSLLKKDNAGPVETNANLSPSDIEKQMKIHLAKQYRQFNRKPTILDILKNIKNSKAMQVTQKTRNESESSDDEPLAKKSRRMRTQNNESNSVSVVPIDQYNLPVEYTDGPLVCVSVVDNQISNTNVDDRDSDMNADGEEDAILGI
ncbi:PREDICTED: uncharacterized protein LOC106128238 [Papilio xuthus]|uniref:Uncharacterized protein LOC106128238 n=1 Tax=Papilio xuthus TaxID=66420 RepID=A0AAJ7EL84_PAPXU|nr:PREDICTED: uncharacterized protein LOC106128238 [Papilio xuthus]XP_013182002.1 PREDICTED: uncharacterized protein LOC106128238 [Papilio xuthus]